jgi:phosphoribosylformylglycinamidine synthase
MSATALKALVITGNGTNCEREMAHACRLAGAEARIAHIAEVFGGEVTLADYQFLNLPGGFLDGDDLGSAKAGAVRFKYGKIEGDKERRFFDDLKEFVEGGGLVLGICNGFQLMVKLGLLPGGGLDGTGDAGGSGDVGQVSSLTHNDSNRFEDRWVHMSADPESPCVFTRGIDKTYMPVRHGEGKFIPGGDAVLAALQANRQIPLRYTDASGNSTMSYPDNPNGSIDSIAGVCDATGRLFGLMPHPEAFLHRTNHPRWTREELPEEGDGLKIFKNAVEYLK